MGQLIPKYSNNKDVLPCKGPFIPREILLVNAIIGLYPSHIKYDEIKRKC